MTRLVHATSIVVKPRRQRREHDLAKQNELQESIRASGLLMAPVIRYEGDTPVLVAGERRLRAILDLYELGGCFRYDGCDVPDWMVPVTLLSELGEIAAEEAELDENIRRVDLSWQERCDAVARLESLRNKQNAAEGASAVTTDDLVREIISAPADVPVRDLGRPYQAAKTDVILARNLHIPEVKAAKSASEAMKVLERLERQKKREEISQIVGRTFHAGVHTLLLGKAEDHLCNLPDDHFDVILTDPPYGMGADNFGDSGGAGGSKGEHFYDDSYENWCLLMGPVLEELNRVCKANAHMYLFCDIDRFHELKYMVGERGWKVFRTPLIFHKPSGMRAPWPDKGPQRKYECILFAVRGEKTVTKILGDVLTYNPDPNMDHPAQKPVALYVDLLKRSTQPGERVLDFCAGSGPIFPACHEVQCLATGIEVNHAAHAMCMERINKLEG